MIFAALALALGLAPSPAAAQRTYSVTDFDRVKVEGPFRVIVETGKPSAARVEGSAKASERVSIEVQGRLLRVRANSSAWGGYPGDSGGTVTVRLATRTLRAATVIGAGSLSVDKVTGLQAELQVSGSGTLDVGNVAADTLALAVIGAGTLTAAGTAKSVKATAQGSSSLDAAALKTLDAQVNAETSGTITLAVDRTAKIVSLGVGNVEIIGKPDCNVTVRGSGAVACGD